jgi:DNA-binding transcriptional ArsR family regulator
MNDMASVLEVLARPYRLAVLRTLLSGGPATRRDVARSLEVDDRAGTKDWWMVRRALEDLGSIGLVAAQRPMRPNPILYAPNKRACAKLVKLLRDILL